MMNRRIFLVLSLLKVPKLCFGGPDLCLLTKDFLTKTLKLHLQKGKWVIKKLV
jgi:hypothetical protein